MPENHPITRVRYYYARHAPQNYNYPDSMNLWAILVYEAMNWKTPQSVMALEYVKQ